MGERYGRAIWASRARLLEFSTCLFDTMVESSRPHSVPNDHSVMGQPSIACATADFVFWGGSSCKEANVLFLIHITNDFLRKKKKSDATWNEMKNGVCALLYYIVHLITVLRNCIFLRFATAGGDWSLGYVRNAPCQICEALRRCSLTAKRFISRPSHLRTWKTKLCWKVRYAPTCDLDVNEWRTLETEWRSDLRRYFDGDHRDLSSIYFSLHLFSGFRSAVCCTQ